MAKLSKGLCLDLANTLSGNIKLLANLFQCSCTAVIQSETKSKHFLLSFGKGSQNFYQLLLKKGENNEGAKRFLKFLKESQEATAIRDAYGYGTAK